MPFTSQGNMLELHSMDGWMLNCIELYALWNPKFIDISAQVNSFLPLDK